MKDRKILAIVTEEELEDIKFLDAEHYDTQVAEIQASNAIYDWFNAMADKYGFSKDIPCAINFDSRIIGETLGDDDQGQPSPPEIVALHQDGTLCEKCGAVIGEPVGEPRLCEGCEE